MRTSISTSITDIDSAAWDALEAGGSPFLRHAFLSTLESTGCVGPETGWLPAPVTMHDARGLAAAAPAYVKVHSYGEFVFDFAWARAYSQHGLHYYPTQREPVFTPAVHSSASGDFYLSIVEVGKDGEYVVVRLITMPGVVWLWISPIVIALGSLIAMWPVRRAREGVAAAEVEQHA